MEKRITSLSLQNPSVFSLILTLIFTLIFTFINNLTVRSQTSYNMVLLKNLAPIGTNNLSYSALWGYTAPNGREYAILGCITGTSFVDITDSLNIHQVGFVPTINTTSGGNIWREMKTYSHYAYIVSEVDSSGIQIVDLQYLPDSIHYVGRKLLPNHRSTHTISQEGPYLYLNGTNVALGSGTAVVDLSVDPENPVLRGSWSQMYVHDSRVLRDTIYACNLSENKISIIDARNKNSLTTITTFPTTPVPQPHNCAVTNDRKYLFSTDEYSDGKLKIWNIQNIHDPILVKRYIPPIGTGRDIVHNVEISGNYALIAYYTAGVQVLDISNPANPVLAGFYDTYLDTNTSSLDGCWAVYKFPSGKIIASDIKRGLFVLRLQYGITGVPVANFSSGPPSIRVGNQVNFFDLSSGNPTSRHWTITGPENFNSSEISPSFIFNKIGQYTVKLKVSNSMGIDSITRVNYVNVIGPLYSAFQFLMPLNFTLNTSPSDTSGFKFIWSKTGTNPYFNYKLLLRKGGSSLDKIFIPGNSGRDTSIIVRKSLLDSVAREYGFANDSAVFVGRVFAFNGTDSLSGSNFLQFTIRTTVGISNISSVIPEEYYLYNNYPNPFNPTTKIKFDLKTSGHTDLKIYDINGRELLKLVNEKLSAGTYEYEFNAANLPSGVYFYKLQSADFSATRKMTLIK